MKSLRKLVAEYHEWDVKFFKAQPIDLNVAADRQRLADIIDCRLSPENLSCDGELSRTEVNRRYTHLTAAAEELLKLDPTVKFYEYA